MYAASDGGKLSVSAFVDCLTSTLMPTDSIWSWTATTLSGSGVAVGVGDGSPLGLAGNVLLARALGVGDACATWLGVGIAGRLDVESSPRSSDPMIMSATPATPRMIGSAHEERRFTVPESSRPSDAPLSRALALSADALAAEPSGLLTDFDGTLSTIVHDPFMAGLVDGADGALEALAERLAVVAIVTGRMPLDARRLVGVPGVLIVGNHGTEWLDPDQSEPTMAADADAVGHALDEALARVPPMPGVVPDHKGVSASIHYRQAPDPEEARSAIVDSLGDLEPLGLRIGHGRMIVEIRAPGLGDKGTAARAIVARFGLRGALVMGDDTTDLDMFTAVAALRGTGRLRAAIVAVGGTDHDVLPEVAAAADVVLDTPADAAELLARLSE